MNCCCERVFSIVCVFCGSEGDTNCWSSLMHFIPGTDDDDGDCRFARDQVVWLLFKLQTTSERGLSGWSWAGQRNAVLDLAVWSPTALACCLSISLIPLVIAELNFGSAEVAHDLLLLHAASNFDTNQNRSRYRLSRSRVHHWSQELRRTSHEEPNHKGDTCQAGPI